MKLIEIKEKNEALVADFEIYMKNNGLKDKTINKHMNAINCFVYEFMTEDIRELVEDAIVHVDEFLGTWIIRNRMHVSVNSIKENITALKKFYKYLLERDIVNKTTFDLLTKIIKENKEIWISTAEELSVPRNVFSTHDMFLAKKSAIEEFYMKDLKESKEQLDQLKQKKIWQRFSKEDILCLEVCNTLYFVVINEETNNEYNIMIYESLIGLNLYLDLLDNKIIHDSQRKFYTFGYEINLKDENLDHLDLFASNIFYHLPGYEKERVDLEDAKIMLNILKRLNQYMTSSNTPIKGLLQKGALQIIDGSNTEVMTVDEINETYKEKVDTSTLEYLFQITEEECKELAKEKSDNQIWEIDSFYFPEKVTSDYHANITLIVDKTNEMVIGKVVDHPLANGDMLTRKIIDTIKSLGKPKNIILSNRLRSSTPEHILEFLELDYEIGKTIITNQCANDFIENLLSGDNDNRVSELIHSEMLVNYDLDSIREICESLCIPFLKSSSKKLLIDKITTYFSDVKHLENVLGAVPLEAQSILEDAAFNDKLFDLKSEDIVEPLKAIGLIFAIDLGEQVVYHVPDKIRDLLKSLNIFDISYKREKYSLLSDFASSCVNLYGVLSLDEFREIARKIIPEIEPIDYEETLQLLMLNYTLYHLDSNYLMHELFASYSHNPNIIIHQNKKLFIPEPKEFMKYKDEMYIEDTEEKQELENYLRTKLNINEKAVKEIIFELSVIASEASLNSFFEVLETYDIVLKNDNQVKEIVNYFTQFRNNCRTWMNRGNTANELFINPNIKIKKVGRNELCPCGSNKKYKKCCEKKQLH